MYSYRNSIEQGTKVGLIPVVAIGSLSAFTAGADIEAMGCISSRE